MNDTKLAYGLLKTMERDLRLAVLACTGMRPEMVEDMHTALTEVFSLLGIETTDSDSDFEFDGLMAEYERRMDAIALEDFDPINPANPTDPTTSNSEDS